jgi:sterol desaturase/sphingolipid hydroxylase (fatty acid hydroxylase superfamily)
MRETPGALALIFALVALAVVFSFLERFAASLPRKALFRRERAVDFLYWFFTPWVTRTASTIGVLLAIGAVTLVVRVAGVDQPSPHWFEAQPKWLQIIELLVAADLLGYLAHRLFHGRRLWRFHAIHHSAEDLDWLSATRLHPVNEIGNRIMQVVPLYLLGFRGESLAALVPILTLWALLIHANLRWDFGPLRYVIASPVFHRWHHTAEEEGMDKNFAGLFPWIDALFGTLYMPRDRQPQKFGVREPVPRGLLAQMAYPFKAR